MRKILFIAALMLHYSACTAQYSKFEEIKKNIDRSVSLNLWDEVLLQATDLIVEEPTKGDGYYYTSLAFVKLDNKNKANFYLDKAKQFADEALFVKIQEFKEKHELTG